MRASCALPLPRHRSGRARLIALGLLSVMACTVLSGCLFPPVSGGSDDEEDPFTVFGVTEGEEAFRLRRAAQNRTGSFETSAHIEPTGGNVGQGGHAVRFVMPADLRRFTLQVDWRDQCQESPVRPPVPPPSVDCPQQGNASAHDLDLAAALLVVNETGEYTVWNASATQGSFGSPDRPIVVHTNTEDDIQRDVETQLLVNLWPESSQGIDYRVEVRYEHLVPLAAP